jgi:NADH-quinone oxidoreductase subunit M
MLYLYWRVAYGTSRNADAAAMPDLTKRELAMLGSIGAVVLWMGVYPESFLAPMRNDVGVLLARIERAAPPSDTHFVKGSAKPAAAHGAPPAHTAPPAATETH